MFCLLHLIITDLLLTGETQVENVTPQPIFEESKPESVEAECSPPPPVTQDAEAQASVEANTESLGEQVTSLESQTAVSTSRPAGEDAQVQTDFTSLPVPPQQPTEQIPPPAELEATGKKDMATLTEELDLQTNAPHTSETSSSQDSPPSGPATVKSIYATNSEPKPKPSNELTRDYIPKVGMTTYTIVPQKSVDKLRYFEVALTLEAPPSVQDEGPNIGSLHLGENTASETQMEVKSDVPQAEINTSTTMTQDTVNGDLPETIHSPSPTSLQKVDSKISSPCDLAFKASSPTEVKEIKIPPATKPKPGSFRLAQHKKIPGYYVTSAAEKSLSASPEKAKLPPPPSPPPVQSQEEMTGAANVQLSPKWENKTVASTQLIRQSSLPCKESSSGLSLEKLRSFAAPRPFTPTTPSRFAQAVSSAVRRSQSLMHGSKSPGSPGSSPSFSPVTSPSAIPELKGFSKLKDGESAELDGDKDSTLQGAETKPQAFSGIVQMEGESRP